MGLEQVGTIDPYLTAAFSPDGETLYVNHDGSEIVAYTYPALTGPTTVYTPGAGNDIEGLACDDTGTVFWWENTHTDPGGQILYRDVDTPALLATSVEEVAPQTLCWSPYDGLLYAVGLFDVTDGETLRSYDPVSGTETVLDAPITTGVEIVNAPVPTLNGGIWWSTPNPAQRSLHRWDIPTATRLRRTIQVDDGGIPRPNDQLWVYGDPLGLAPFGGSYFDADLDRLELPLLDGFSPGVRACAYTPDLALVAFERGATGEVWTIDMSARWRIGRIGWPT